MVARALIVVLCLAVACRQPPHADTSPTDFSWDSAAPHDSGDAPPVVPELGAVNDGAYLPLARELVDAATERVWAIEYLLVDSGEARQLVDALEDAARRGVDVRVLADETGSDTAGVIARLSAAGAQAKLDSPATTTHNKLLLIDEVALVGSHNVTSAALTRNVEASAVTTMASVTAFYRDYFEAMWADSDDPGGLEKPEPGPVVPLYNREVTPAFEACLDGAVGEVDLLMYALAYNPAYPDSEVTRLVEAVEQAHQRGVTVRVALDDSDWIREHAINVAATSRLVAAGVPVRRTPAARTHHAKVLRCDSTVIVSDANWSYSGLALYNGTSLQATGEPLAADTQAWFAQIWDGSAPAE